MMTTVPGEQTYLVQGDHLLDKTPVSAQMQDTIEVLSTNNEMEAQDSAEEDLDLHVCGKCKTEFTNIQHYVDHKRLVCSKQSPAKSQESPPKMKRRHDNKLIITSTSAVTAIMEPQEQSFCETVIEEGVVADDPGSEVTHHEIIKAARASENQNDEEKVKETSKKKPKLTAGDAKIEIEPSETASEVPVDHVFKCNVCEKEFDRPETLVVHQFMHKKFHQCTDCKRSFVSEENLGKHRRDFKHVFKCRICMVELASQEDKKVHETSHTRQFECVDCKKKFYTDKTLARHREKVLHNLPCDKCEKVCRDKHALSKHQESHMRIKSHVCDFDAVCERGFRTALELEKHKKSVHLGIKEHKCVECGKEFARKDKLNRHLLIHSPNRPTYPCPFKTFTGCAKTFYRKDKLQRHIFAHSKEKPYKCDTCAKLFARKDNLTEHTRIHTGEFKHRCPVCNKGMGGPKKLLLHVQQKHSGVDEIIPVKPTMVGLCLPSSNEVATITTANADASAASWVEENMAVEPKQEDLVKPEIDPESFNTDARDEDDQHEEQHLQEQDLEQPQHESEGVQQQQHHQQQHHQQQHQQQQPPQLLVKVKQQQHAVQQHQHRHLQHDTELSKEQQQQEQQHDSKLSQQQQHQPQQQHLQNDTELPQQQQHHHQQVLQFVQQQAPQQHELPSRPLPPPLQQHQQQQIRQSQTMIVHPSQVPPTTVSRVAVHFLANNNSSGQPRGHYVPALHQGGQNVTQSETALLHEVLSELATRSLFNS